METVRGVALPSEYKSFEDFFDRCAIDEEVTGSILVFEIEYETILGICGSGQPDSGKALQDSTTRVSAEGWRELVTRAKDIYIGDKHNAETLEKYKRSLETINGDPDLYEVGRTYRTLDGQWITVLRSFGNTVLGSDGKHRYNVGLDCGRVTWSSMDYSYGGNFERTYKRRDALALETAQRAAATKALEAEVARLTQKSQEQAARIVDLREAVSGYESNCRDMVCLADRRLERINELLSKVKVLENALDQCKAAGQERIQEHESILKTWKEHSERCEQANVRLRNQVTELKCASANMNSTSPTPMTFGLDASLEKLESGRYGAVKAACCEDNPTAMATVGNGAVADSIYEPLYQEHLAQGVVLETVKGQLKQALKTKQFFADRVKTRRNAYLRLRRELRSILRKLPPCRFKDEVNAAIDAADDSQRPTGSMS